MNRVTRANVDVQPYAFTTKSLFVGHMDYKYLRWQVIDTPGVLDKPLEERNTIEMQSITALAHLQCCVMYVLDISEECGHSIAEQVALFEQIKPLFLNKPLVVAVNKTDARDPSTLTPEEEALLQRMRDAGATIVYMSTFTEEGIKDVKQTACDLLLAQRVEAKLQSSRVESVIGRIRVAEPQPQADGVPVRRQTYVPESVLAARAAAKQAKPAQGGAGSSTDLPDFEPAAPKRVLQRDLEEEHGGAGVYSLPLQRQWELRRPEWADDMIPEIMDGKNIADFIDPEIEAKLDELEREEEERAQLAALEAEADPMEDDAAEAHAQVAKLASAIRKKKGVIKETARRDRAANHPTLPRNVKARSKSTGGMVAHLSSIGIETEAKAMSNLRSKAKARSPAADEEERGRSTKRRPMADAMDVEGEAKARRGASRERSGSRVPSDRSATRRDSASVARSRSPARTGLRDEAALKKAEKLAKKKQFLMNKMGKATESDRRIAIKKPKHLYSGKRGLGKTDRR